MPQTYVLVVEEYSTEACISELFSYVALLFYTVREIYEVNFDDYWIMFPVKVLIAGVNILSMILP